MLNHYRSILTMLSMLFILAACSSNPDDPEVIAIQVTSEVNTLAAGLTTRLKANLFLDDGSTVNNVDVSWQSMNPEIATVGESSGVVTAIAPGQAIIKATFKEVSEEVTATVTDALLKTITIDQMTPTVAVGRPKSFTATGHFSDGSQHDITKETGIEWKSSAPEVASIDAKTGLSTGLKKGSTIISVTKDGVISFPNATLTVTDAQLVNFIISPDSSSKPKGITDNFSATGYYTDNTKQDITGQVNWISENPNIIRSLGGGTFKAIAVGEGQISATTIDGTMSSDNKPTFTATHAELTSLEVQGEAQQPLGKSTQFKAIAGFTDDKKYNVSGYKQVYWQSSNPDVATVTLAGVVKGISEGEATISVLTTFSNDQANQKITITEKEAESLAINNISGDRIISQGTEQQFNAVLRYTDGSINENIEQSADFSWSTIERSQFTGLEGDDVSPPTVNMNQETGVFSYISSGGYPYDSGITAQYKEIESAYTSVLLTLPENISSEKLEFIGVLSFRESEILSVDYSSFYNEQVTDKSSVGFSLMTYSQAKNHCENLRYDGFSDWRLPTSDELIELWRSEDGTNDDTSFGKGWAFSINYWSDTPSGIRFKSVSLLSGEESESFELTQLYASCVRER